MTSPEELAKEKFGWLCDSLPVEHYEWLVTEITALIHLDRLSIRKRCAEVARDYFEMINGVEQQGKIRERTKLGIAKAIEEMNL